MRAPGRARGLSDSERRVEAQRIREATREQIRAILTPGAARQVRLGADRGAAGAAGRGLGARLHVWARTGSRLPSPCRPASPTATSPRSSGGDLKEGQEVIVGVADAQGCRRTPEQRPAPAGSSMGGTLIETHELTKDYHLGGQVGARAPPGLPRDSRGGLRGRHGPVRLRQVHLHESPRLPRRAHLRALRARRPGRLEPLRRRPRQDPQRRRSASSSRASTSCPGPRRSRTWSCPCSTRASTPARGASTPRPSSSRSGWRTGPTTIPPSSRAASSSAWPSRARSSTIPSSSSPTSRRATSTRARASRSWPSSRS